MRFPQTGVPPAREVRWIDRIEDSDEEEAEDALEGLPPIGGRLATLLLAGAELGAGEDEDREEDELEESDEDAGALLLAREELDADGEEDAEEMDEGDEEDELGTTLLTAELAGCSLDAAEEGEEDGALDDVQAGRKTRLHPPVQPFLSQVGTVHETPHVTTS